MAITFTSLISLRFAKAMAPMERCNSAYSFSLENKINIIRTQYVNKSLLCFLVFVFQIRTIRIHSLSMKRSRFRTANEILENPFHAKKIKLKIYFLYHNVKLTSPFSNLPHETLEIALFAFRTCESLPQLELLHVSHDLN